MSDYPVSPLDALTLPQLRRRHSVKWRSFDPDVLPLWVAEMDTPLAPPIAQALSDAVSAGDTGYAHIGGLPAAFARFAERRFGWNLKGTTPLVVADVMAGVRAVLEQVSRPGDKVVVSTPAYPPFFANVAKLDRTLVASPLRQTPDGYRLDLDRMEHDFAGAAVYLLCNPHNPAGRVFDHDELTAIAALADRHDVTVISDEIHAPLTMPGQRHIPFATLDAPAAARGYTMMAASKAWNLAGLKTALLIPGAEAARDWFDPDYSVGASLFGVLASTAAYDAGEEWLDSLIAGLDTRRALLGEMLAASLPEVRYVPPQGTYLTWLDFSAYGLDTDPATRLLERGRVAVNSGLDFGRAGRGYVRLNIATSIDILTEAVERMAKAMA